MPPLSNSWIIFIIYRYIRPLIVVLRLMDKILHDPKDPKLWELWYIPYCGSCRILPINRIIDCYCMGAVPKHQANWTSPYFEKETGLWSTIL